MNCIRITTKLKLLHRHWCYCCRRGCLFFCRQEEADAELQFGSCIVSAAELKELSWTFYSSELLSALHQMYKQKVCCDIILSAGGFQVATHKVILMATSDLLKSLIADHEPTAEAIHLTGKYSCV